jgi:hypothetical protein
MFDTLHFLRNRTAGLLGAHSFPCHGATIFAPIRRSWASTACLPALICAVARPRPREETGQRV